MKKRMSAAFAAMSIAFCGTAMAAGTVEWTFPRLGNCHEGMAFADGKTGVLLWGGGDTVNLTIGRGDMWDHRGGYTWTAEQSYTNIVDAVQKEDKARLAAMFRKETPKGEPRNPYMLPFGRVVVKIPGAELKKGVLDVFSGTARIDFTLDGRERSFEAAMCKAGGGTFGLGFPEDVKFAVRSMPCTEFGVYERNLKPLGFKKAVVSDGADAGGWTWELPADPPAALEWRKDGKGGLLVQTRRLRKAGEKPLLDAVRKCAAFAEVKAAAKAQWARFWAEGAKVRVPDPVVQRVFDYGMYRFGAMTDPDGIPAGLQGAWLEDDRLVPWNGDYHFNINVQECYGPACKGGHFDHLLPLFRMVLSWRGTLAENARKFVGIDDGYVLPHSVSDQGVNIGGFWTGTIDHGSTAWVADMMWRYVRYSGDTGFLKNGGYDFMKGAMRVYRAMMEEREGRLSLPVGPSPEWGGASLSGAVGRDSSFQLAAAHALARDLIEAAKLIGEKPDPAWLDVQKRLPRFTADESGVCLFKGQRFTASHRHHSHMAGFFPFDVIDMRDPANKAVVDATYKTWDQRGTKGWTGWCVPWAAVLNVHAGRPDRAVGLLKAWDAYFCDEGHGSHHNAVRPGFTNFNNGRGVMQMDGQCAAAAAVLELFAHSTGGRIELFKGCPDSWKEVSFENIALPGGRRVSGRRVDGKIEAWDAATGKPWRGDAG